MKAKPIDLHSAFELKMAEVLNMTKPQYMRLMTDVVNRGRNKRWVHVLAMPPMWGPEIPSTTTFCVSQAGEDLLRSHNKHVWVGKLPDPREVLAVMDDVYPSWIKEYEATHQIA